MSKRMSLTMPNSVCEKRAVGTENKLFQKQMLHVSLATGLHECMLTTIIENRQIWNKLSVQLPMTGRGYELVLFFKRLQKRQHDDSEHTHSFCAIVLQSSVRFKETFQQSDIVPSDISGLLNAERYL